MLRQVFDGLAAPQCCYAAGCGLSALTASTLRTCSNRVSSPN